MSRAATSVLVYGIFLIGQGLLLLVVPNFALGLFGLPATQEVWVRIVGYTLLALAGYFLVAARNEVTDFFVLSVVLRLSFPVVLGLFVAMGYARPALLLLAPTEIVFALWTLWGLRSSRVAVPMAR